MTETAKESPPESREEAASPEADEEKPAGKAEEGGKERPPFSLEKGRRIRYGPRKGKVETVRGGGRVPYDALIRWEGEKYPQWFLYTNLRGAYDRGELEIEG